MFTLSDVRKMLVELDNQTGLSGATLELKVKNTKKELACHVHKVRRNASGQVVERVPVRFEFSKLILSCDEQTLSEVVKHEYAHYMSVVKYNDNCGDDYRFKKMCVIIGANANEPTFTNNSLQQQSMKMAKYNVICGDCNHVYNYHRMCGVLKSIKVQDKTVQCHCGSYNLTVKQNY